MPNRMLRDWTNSDKIDSISFQSEVFFTRLIMKADDFGCFWADAKRLKSNLFPLRSDSIRETDILRWMAECQKAELIVVYESDGKGYLQIIEFGQRLRTKKSKYPKPTDSNLLTNVGDMRQPVGKSPPEEEENIEEEGKEDQQAVFKIEDCFTIALKDNRWVKANNTNSSELAEFNRLLESRGHYEKNPLDYKTHFSNWKRLGKKSDIIPSSTTTITNIREQRAAELLNSIT